MKVFCVIAMCSVAWAGVANLDTLITNCSDGSRISRLQALQKNLHSKKTNMEGYERMLGILLSEMQKIIPVIMEHPHYEDHARKFLQMQFLLGAIGEIKKAEGPETKMPKQQITVKQLMDNIASAIYVLPQIITAIEMLEKEIDQGGFERSIEKGEIVFEETTYKGFIEAIAFLGIHKILLLSMMKDLEDIRTPIADLTTESTRCSTRQVHSLAGMTYVP